MKAITRSPWGRVQSVDELIPGVVFVSTAGHGGLKLDRAHNAKVPAEYRRPSGWYEEDCEWAIAAGAVPEIRAALKSENDAIANTLARYFRTIYRDLVERGLVASTKQADKIVQEEESNAKRLAFIEANNLHARCSALAVDDWAKG